MKISWRIVCLSFSFVFLWIRIEFLSVWKWISFRTMVWYGERNQSCSVLFLFNFFFFFYVIYFLLGGAGIDRQYQISDDVKRNSKKKKVTRVKWYNNNFCVCVCVCGVCASLLSSYFFTIFQYHIFNRHIINGRRRRGTRPLFFTRLRASAI